MRRARQTRPRTLVRTVTAALALVARRTARRVARPRPPTSPHRRPASSPRSARSPSPRPGDFTGYGFDQCLAPTQSAMDALAARTRRSSRSASTSPATPAPAAPSPTSPRPGSRTQLARGWRLLPITLGPQASCQPRFPRYGDDSRSTRARHDGGYATARAQGARRGRQDRRRRQRATASARAARSGTTSRASTCTTPTAASPRWRFRQRLDHADPRARLRLRRLLQRRARASRCSTTPGSTGPASSPCPTGSGSPAGTARPTPPRPTSARTAGARSARIKQYQGGHDETWGGVTINIDRNFLDLGARLARRAGDALHAAPGSASRATRARARRPRHVPTRAVKALQCLLTEQGTLRRQDQRRLRRRHHRRAPAPGRPPATSRRARPGRTQQLDVAARRRRPRRC